MADPFAVVNNPSPSAQPGTGALGASPDFWTNLMNFGASLATGANARTGGGFLANGPGFAGPLGAGILGAEEQQRQNAGLNSQMNLQRQQAGLTGAQAQITRFQLPFMMAELQALGGLQGGNGPGAPSAGNSGAPQGLGQRIAGVETGGQPNSASAVNPGGYAGTYQFGTAALNAAGLYQPAQGEDLTKNQWKGTITLPGQKSMNFDQFRSDPAAQTAAWNTQQSYLNDQANKLGFDNYVGKTVGGVQITPSAVIAAMQFAGPTGTQKFLSSNGQYNPADANGTTITDYISRVQNQPMPGQSYGAQGRPSSTIPPGMATPQQAIQQAAVLRQKAQMWAMFNPGAAAGLNQQADNLEKYAYGSVAPQRGYAGGYTITANGITRSGTPTTIKNPDGSETRAVEFPPVIDNNGVALPGYITPLALASGSTSPGTGQPGSTNATAHFIGYNGTSAAPAATAATALPVPPTPPPGGNGTALAELSPTEETFLGERGKGLGEQFQQVDAAAANANANNYLFDNLRRDSQSWRMGKFADWQADARSYLQAIATATGLKGSGVDALNNKLSDFQAFQKSAGMLLRQAVRETSSRAAVQEYRMISNTLPNPENTQQAFGQIADQWQALNDYNIAKQQFAHQYLADPEQMNVDWNKSVSPTAFLINRMMRTAGGTQDFTTVAARLGQTVEGRKTLEGMLTEYNYSQQHGLFSGLDYANSGGQSAQSAPAVPAASQGQ